VAISGITPYSGMGIYWYDTPKSYTIGGTPYDFSVVISGNQGTAEEIYEFVQWRLRYSGDINDGVSTRIGKTTKSLLQFVGDTLYCLQDDYGSGVYISNFQTGDTNRLVFIDNAGSAISYPYTAILTLNFGANLVADTAAVYRVFFTNDDIGLNLGYDFGTANAITVNDNDSVQMSGIVNGNSTIARTYNYDGNVQRGPTSSGTVAPITAVAIGLSTGQYVSATTNIARSTSNSISLVAPLERNYQNP
jgi:hypothetical protein